MAPKINFNAIANKTSNGIVVNGVSEGFPGAKLIHRHVALQQDEKAAEGPATLAAEWQTDPALDDKGFTTGVVAVGTELYLVNTGTEGGASPTFVTMTWSETLEIE
jgi:hypothetical protein